MLMYQACIWISTVILCGLFCARWFEIIYSCSAFTPASGILVQEGIILPVVNSSTHGLLEIIYIFNLQFLK